MPFRAAPRLFLVPVACLMLIAVGQTQPFEGGHVSAGVDLPDNALQRGLSHWDGGWYMSIARDGYWYRPGEASPVAFFPAYPMMVRALAALGLNRWVAGSLISLLCGLGAVLLFGVWCRQVAPNREAAGFAVWVLALYPFAFYLYGVLYSDGVFLLFGIAAFLALEKRQPLLAALLGALATLSRPLAPAIVIGLVARSLELRLSKKERPTALDLLPLAAGLGLLTYMLFLNSQFQDPLAFVHVQSAPGWDQTPGWHTWLKVPWFQTLFPRVAPLVASYGGRYRILGGPFRIVEGTWGPRHRSTKPSCR